MKNLCINCARCVHNSCNFRDYPCCECMSGDFNHYAVNKVVKLCKNIIRKV